MSQKICVISGKSFIFSDQEKEFYQKITPVFAGKKFEIPEPTICAEERTRQRAVHRNEQYLHKGVSCFSGNPLITIYPENFRGKICTREKWFSDQWNRMENAQEFNLEKEFFRQYAELQAKIPRANLVGNNNINCDYATGIGDSKNCYLVNSTEHAEDCMYSKLLQRCRDVCDSSYIYDSELLYECFNCDNCFDSQYLQNCKNCSSSWFLKNCIGCNNCFGCVNLRQKEYFFLNKQYSKKEYEQKIAELKLAKRSSRAGMRENFIKFTHQFPHKYAEIFNSEDSTGDFILNSKNCHNYYDLEKSQDCWNIYVGAGNKDVYDCCNVYIKMNSA